LQKKNVTQNIINFDVLTSQYLQKTAMLFSLYK